ncbi:queuosine precursor transporter [Vineibacter terrae]|uniref:Probable queuosine precursor transporter n=1 Tax=Vineibacter terrae TaxID=2586908 RepID=A0A5C8PH56_9HYPH|nr:queuosine precursor transporter [Vineibacter terrae]TXL72841.1 queuosine precursor transporter [Vineibacter terrae]
MTGISRGMGIAIAAMVGVVALSNYVVQFEIFTHAVLGTVTWGALTYPATFFVTDLANRAFGPRRARQVVYVGFAAGIVASLLLAPWRIALASGTAFLVGQLLDIVVFDRLRRAPWWQAPFAGSALGSIVDTVLFFGVAFVGIFPLLPGGAGPSVLSLIQGDLIVKLSFALLFLAPFRALMGVVVPMRPAVSP